MITSSLHNHCSLCDGADTLENMVKAAFEAGITDFGISCHSFVDFDRECSINNEDEYISIVKDFISFNTFPINIYLGVEEDYLGRVKRRNEYDYIIGSVHYLYRNGAIYCVDLNKEQLLRCLNEGFDGDADKLAEAYYDCVIKEAERGVDIIGHFDLIRKFGDGIFDFGGRRYIDLAFGAIDTCIAKNTIFELNYGAIQRNYLRSPYPEKILLERLAEKGARVTVSTDCHTVKGITFGLSEAPEYLRSLGFKEVTVMQNGKFTSIKL